MAKTENAKKVPGALVAAVVVIVAIAAFVPTVYMPYKNKKPAMDEAHKEALDTIEYYDNSIKNQASIEAEINDLQAQWDKYQEDMFVDAKTTIKDLTRAIDARGDIIDLNIKVESATPDPSGLVTADGNPLYFNKIKLTGRCDRETLLSLLKFIEEDSIGHYYVQKYESKPVEVTDSDGNVVDKEMFENTIDFYLYYFNQNEKVAVVASDTDTATDSSK